MTRIEERLLVVPGNDVIYTITVGNSGSGPADDDSVVIFDALPAELEFFNGDTDGPTGPESGAIAFVDSGSGLSFDIGDDAGFSDQAVAPSDFSACVYDPSVGYDPTGSFDFSPAPVSFSIQFRGRIK